MLKPAAPALIVTGWAPSLTPSLTPLTLKVAVCWPAPIVTVAGTTASVVSLDDRVTVSAAFVSVLRRTVTVADPVSAMTLRSRLSERLALSSSRTCSDVVAEPLGRTALELV